MKLLSNGKLAFDHHYWSNIGNFIWLSLCCNKTISYGPTYAVTRQQRRKQNKGGTCEIFLFHVVGFQSRAISSMLLLHRFLMTTLKLDGQESTYTCHEPLVRVPLSDNRSHHQRRVDRQCGRVEINPTGKTFLVCFLSRLEMYM